MTRCLTVAAVLLACAAGVALAQEQVSTANLDVDWERVAMHSKRLSWQALTEDQREAVRLSNVPVLLPAELVWADGQRLQITTGRGWYAASFHGDEYEPTVLVHGTTMVILVNGERLRVLPTLWEEHTAMAPTRGEGIVEVAFEAFGAAYNLSVECYGSNDHRCAEDRYVLALTDDLMFAAPGE